MKKKSIWNRLRKVLFVMQFTDVESLIDWRRELKNTGLSSNEFQILSIVANKKDRQVLKEVGSVTFLAENDFSILGKLKNEKAIRTLGVNYDSLFVFGDQKRKIMKIVEGVNSKVNVGLNTTIGNYQIVLDTPSSTPRELLGFVKHTLEKIA